MKIYCEKCHCELTKTVDERFESCDVGKIQCPKCGKIQKRYISEADLLTYFSASEILYLGMFILTILVYQVLGVSIITMVALIGVLALAYYSTKAISHYVYDNGVFKKETMNREFKEDAKAIKRRMRILFSVFVVMAMMITSGAVEAGIVYTGFMLILVGYTFAKTYVAVSKEKKNK